MLLVRAESELVGSKAVMAGSGTGLEDASGGLLCHKACPSGKGNWGTCGSCVSSCWSPGPLSGCPGCAAEKPRLASVNTNPSPYASGKIHTEPLYYNGKTYQVRMQHRVSDGIFLVNVSAPGRRLGTTPGDGEIVSEVGRNAVNHFACPDSQRARVQPGSARPAANQGWDMRVKCG
jgi:hypothetical protein